MRTLPTVWLLVDGSGMHPHLEALASAGATGQGAFAPTTRDALVAALGQIHGGAASCEVRVEGSIVAGRECAGEVSLNGQPLACNGPDGYRVADDRTTLVLQGGCVHPAQDLAPSQRHGVVRV